MISRNCCIFWREDSSAHPLDQSLTLGFQLGAREFLELHPLELPTRAGCHNNRRIESISKAALILIQRNSPLGAARLGKVDLGHVHLVVQFQNVTSG